MRIKKPRRRIQSFRRLAFEISEERCLLAVACSLGDSNLDGQSDSSDLVQVFQVGEFEDAITANSTCEGGDWNGDSEFDGNDLVSLLFGGLYFANGPQPGVDGQPLTPGGVQGSGATAIVYDPDTGSVDISVPSGTLLTTFQLQSVSGAFVGSRPASLSDDSFDAFNPYVAFNIDSDGFSSLSLGPILLPGLSESELLSDLRVDGQPCEGVFCG